MRDEFQNVLNDYQEAYGQKYTDHPLASLIRQTIPDLVRQLITEPERYLLKGSAGAGNWTNIPWIALFDILITDTAQSGYYPVFLFKDDMSGFYLSLNQGVTEIKEKYKREAKQVLKLKAEDYRAQLGSLPKNFNITEIKLKNLKTTNSPLAGLYEAGNIFAKYYASHEIPSDAQLHSDISEILKIYEALSYNEGLPTTQAEKETDEEKFKGFEDLRKFRFHKRVERNVQLSKKVKSFQGYRCKACDINFEDKYGQLGKEYIEAHHLKPISHLTGERVQLDARTDFTVLCSNCHSMIHRLEDPSDLNLLKSIIKNNSR
jgi:5-methylcytosine-specific restriction protein A